MGWQRIAPPRRSSRELFRLSQSRTRGTPPQALNAATWPRRKFSIRASGKKRRKICREWLSTITSANRAGSRARLKASRAPANYEEHNVFGTPTGNRIDVNNSDPMPLARAALRGGASSRPRISLIGIPAGCSAVRSGGSGIIFRSEFDQRAPGVLINDLARQLTKAPCLHSQILWRR
jgi:hypothetical protein